MSDVLQRWIFGRETRGLEKEALDAQIESTWLVRCGTADCEAAAIILCGLGVNIGLICPSLPPRFCRIENPQPTPLAVNVEGSYYSEVQ
jgi:hypothetical protein